MLTGIDLILADHQRVNELFALFDDTKSAVVAGQIFMELTAHDEVEVHALYPLAANVLGADTVDEALLDHANVKLFIERARALEGAPFDQAMTVLREAVQAHVATEEGTLLPKLSEEASDAELDGLAARIEQIKQRVG